MGGLGNAKKVEEKKEGHDRKAKKKDGQAPVSKATCTFGTRCTVPNVQIHCPGKQSRRQGQNQAPQQVSNIQPDTCDEGKGIL
jgi:hypothetical protein